MDWNAKKFGGWEYVRDLGTGGQGQVYLVRSPESQAALRGAVTQLQQAVVNIRGNSREAESFVKAIAQYMTLTDERQTQSQLGALKAFKIPDDPREADKAKSRFEAEVKALKDARDPALLRLLASGDRWMVTEYHPGGTLAGAPERFKGDAAGALAALRPVVAGVSRLHKDGKIHRDIKPPNLFFSDRGGLVLGDFGIVFFEGDSTRVTTTLERVGSRDWMPPWAMGLGPDDVSPKFDVYALGKVLYCMVSGRPSLVLWYHGRPGNRLSALCSDQRSIAVIQKILDASVCEEEHECVFASASELLAAIDDALSVLRSHGEVLVHGERMQCRVCRRGVYKRIFPPDDDDSSKNSDRLIACVRPGTQGNMQGIVNLYDPGGATVAATPFLCTACGHVALFRLDDKPPAWQRGQERPVGATGNR